MRQAYATGRINQVDLRETRREPVARAVPTGVPRPRTINRQRAGVRRTAGSLRGRALRRSARATLTPCPDERQVIEDGFATSPVSQLFGRVAGVVAGAATLVGFEIISSRIAFAPPAAQASSARPGGQAEAGLGSARVHLDPDNWDRRGVSVSLGQFDHGAARRSSGEPPSLGAPRPVRVRWRRAASI